MTDDTPAYRLEMVGAKDHDPSVEYMDAASDRDALDLAALRLLLGPDYLIVTVFSGERILATYRRDDPRRRYESVH